MKEKEEYIQLMHQHFPNLLTDKERRKLKIRTICKVIGMILFIIIVIIVFTLNTIGLLEVYNII